MAKNKLSTLSIGVSVLSVLILLCLVCQKYLPFFLHSTIYYCQNILHTIASKPLSIGLYLTLGFIVARLLILLVKMYKESRQFSHAVLPEEELKKLTQELLISKRVLVVKDSQPLAVCFGIFQPKIYLSSSLLRIASLEELRVILLHEKYHLDHHDNLSLFIATVIQASLPFFPIINDYIASYRIQREIDADGAATMSGSTHLLSALKKLIQAEPQYAFISASGLGVFETLATRIGYLVYKTEYHPKVSLINCVISVIFLFAFLTLTLAPIQAIEYHEQGRDAVMVCITNNKSIIPIPASFSPKSY